MTAESKKDLPTFILASGSPRRKKLLQYLNIPFITRPSSVDEEVPDAMAAYEVARSLALRKSRDIARGTRSAVVLGADTIVVHNDAILGKPASAAEARAMLRTLKGTTHTVITGVALVRTNETGTITADTVFTERTDVTFGKPDEDAIARYVETGSPMDKAGAYGIQDARASLFVQGIKGDYYNIVGLPLHTLYRRLQDFAPALAKLHLDPTS